MGQHLIFRPPGLYIDHLLEGVGGGSGVHKEERMWIGAEGESGRRRRVVGAVAAGGLVGFGLLRGVLPLETHTDSGGLLAAPPPLRLTVKYVQDQHVFLARLWSGRTRSNGSREGGRGGG